MKDINSQLIVKATAILEEEAEKELQTDDPSEKEAKDIIKNNEIKNS